MPSEDPYRKSKRAGKYLRFLNLGFEFFVAIGVLTFAGVWLDRKAGTTALFTILGAILGFATGFRLVYRALFPPPAGRERRGVEWFPPLSGRAREVGRDSDAKSGRVGDDGEGSGEGEPGNEQGGTGERGSGRDDRGA